MTAPNTADERERRFVQYLLTLNKGQIAELRLSRMNRIANFRKALMEIVNNLVETRAEDLAAAMLWKYAPERPKRVPVPIAQGRIAERRRTMPPWIKEQSKVLGMKR
jgi:hypothetical protein